MISLQNIGLTYNDKKILRGISWLITERSRIGLVGDNGAGKTTLFRAIKGETSLDSGAIEIPKNKRIGYLPQDLVELSPSRSGLFETENRAGRAGKKHPNLRKDRPQ